LSCKIHLGFDALAVISIKMILSSMEFSSLQASTVSQLKVYLGGFAAWEN